MALGFYAGVLGPDGMFRCDDGWSAPAVRDKSREPVLLSDGVHETAFEKRVILKGDHKKRRTKPILFVQEVYVQETLA